MSDCEKARLWIVVGVVGVLLLDADSFSGERDRGSLESLLLILPSVAYLAIAALDQGRYAVLEDWSPERNQYL